MPIVTTVFSYFAARLELRLGRITHSSYPASQLPFVSLRGNRMSKVTTLLAFLVVATALVCQTGPSPAETPAASSNVHQVHLVPVTHTDMHCSGFITSEHVPHDHFVMAGWDSPNFVRYATDDYVYLHGAVPEGTEYSIIRELRDPDRYEFFPGQHRAIDMAGEPYAEIRRVKA